MDWRICRDKDRTGLIQFLIENEKNAVAMINRFYRENQWLKIPDSRKGTIFIYEKDNRIEAVCFFSNNGLILPVFSFLPGNEVIRELLISAAGRHLKIHSVMGIKRFIQPFRNIAASDRSRFIDYFYMISPPGNTGYMKYLQEIKNSEELSVMKARPSNCSEIYPLHRAYEIEEVLIDATRYNAAFSYMLLKKTLKKEQVYLLRLNKQLAAKCNSNATSMNFVQVGGMFTLPELRNRGYGTMVLAAMMEEAEKNGKNVCLFVKKKNLPAVALYKKLGFKQVDEYAILYL